MLRLLILVALVAGCGSRPPSAPGPAAPWGELTELPARAELAVAVASASDAARVLADGADLGGDELAAWLAPRFAGRIWPLERLADAGLDAGSVVAAARLDREAATTVRSAGVADEAALRAAVTDAIRAAGASPGQWTVGDTDILVAGDDALVVRAGRAYFVHSGARSQRDRAAVEIAARDGDTLGKHIGALVTSIGGGDLAVVARGPAARELFASESGADAAAAVLTVTETGIRSRVAVTPAPDSAEVELGLPVDPVPLPEAALPVWPAAPRDDNPDVPLSAEYEAVSARLTALEAERQRLARAVQLLSFEARRDVDRAFSARTAWQRRGAIAAAVLTLPLPGASITTAVAAARGRGEQALAERDRVLARYRAAAVDYAAIRDQLIHVRARDVAAHDRRP